MLMDDLREKVALITGSSRGIGRAIAIELARAGADIVINYRNRSNDALDVHTQIHALGRACTAIQADVSRGHEIDRLVREAGPIDILVNNAGIARPQPLEEITESDWDEVVDTNLKSCFLLTQAYFPECAPGGGGASSTSRQWRRRSAEWSVRTTPRPKPACTG